jgi:DUF1680 family protein
VRRDWRVGDHVELRLPMPPRLTEPHPRIESSRDCVAIERGPLVYCLEQSDQPNASVLDVCIDTSAPLVECWRPDLLGGIVTIEGRGNATDVSDWSSTTFRRFGSGAGAPRASISVTAIPYYAWANRTPGAMRVWIPTEPSGGAAQA